MNTLPSSSPLARSWSVLLLFGVVAIVFGVLLLVWPDRSVLALVLTFGILALADGVVSLIGAFRNDLALPRWLLVVYAVLSIAFGALALLNPVSMAAALIWVLAFWLIVAGIARIVFAVQVRKLVRGEWLLALSGVLAIALGVLFLVYPGAGIVAVAFWIAIGALIYGALQIFSALRLRNHRQRVV